MSAPFSYPVGQASWGRTGGVGPRTRERLLAAASVVGLATIALAISVAMPAPTLGNLVLVVGVICGVAAVIALMLSARYTVTLALLAIYLGLLDGPIKLESASKAASGVRDLLIIAIGMGMLMRLGLRRERISLPPLSGWVVAFVVVVLVQALNPNTGGILKSVGGYRQQLEWVPFFFFGYMMMRSKLRFRQLFLLLGVLALANGVVGAYQSWIGPDQLAGWGPGYTKLVTGGTHGLTARTYVSEGVVHARPPALGSDSGFGGGIGAVALPGLLALLAAGRLRRRWPVLLCSMGALLGIATSASRTSAVMAVVVLLGFAALSLLAGLRVSRQLAGVLTIALITFAVGVSLLAIDGKGVFARQETLTSTQSAQEHGGEAKERSLSQIPSDLIHAPFGLGLGTSGSVAGFGGHQRLEIEGEKVKGGSAYTMLIEELGLPGLLLWIGLTVNVLALAARQLRRVRDTELRTYLVGLLTAFIALTLQGLSGPTLGVTVGAFLWFVPGAIAYWFAGPGRAAIDSGAKNGSTGAGRARLGPMPAGAS
jgi:hypothetical protein